MDTAKLSQTSHKNIKAFHVISTNHRHYFTFIEKKQPPPFSDRKEINSRVIGSHFQHPEDTLKFGPNGFTGKVMFVSLYIKQKVTHTNQNESLEKDL